MRRQVEIDDTLKERVKRAQEELKEEVISYLDENPDTDEAPDLSNDIDYSGTFHEIVDGSVPIYTSEIEDTWYLYSGELEEAYENAGVGDNPRENNGMSAIYFYIHQEVSGWYEDNKDDIFNEWKKGREEKAAEAEKA